MDANNPSGLKYRSGLSAVCLLLGLLAAASVARGQQNEETARQLLQLHSKIAWRTLNLGNLPRAEAMFRDILRRDPDRPRDIAGLSAALARQGKTDEAIDVLKEGVERFPQDAILASALGQAHLSAQNNQRAMHWLEQANRLDETMPDVPYFLGSSYLNCEYPLLALNTMCGAATSRREMEWSQDLAIGIAFSQLGLQCEAGGYFAGVEEAAMGTPLADRAAQFQQQMDDALLDRDYLRGSLKITFRYDDNPGVIPAASSTSGALAAEPSWGNQYLGQFSYDIVRDYNFDATVGYNFLHTSNYTAHGFDVIDNGVYLATDSRQYWWGIPVHLGWRFDYDHMFVGSEDFLQRASATPSLTLIQSDEDSTTLMFRYTRFDFLGQGVFNNTAFDLDGDNLMIGVTRQRLYLCRDLALFAGYQYDHNLSDGRNYDYGGHRLRVGMNWETPWNGLQVNASGDVQFRSYDHPHSVFGINRDDEEFGVQVGLLYPLCDQWWATLQWNFNRNDSNLSTNDYHRHTLDFGLVYRFPYSDDE